MNRGKAGIEGLIEAGRLERVTPSVDVANRLVADAEAHIVLAGLGLDEDPSGALQLSYDAARKATTSLLAVQGIRATTKGGHVAVIDAARALFDDDVGPGLFGKLHRLRRRRNATEYPSADSPTVTEKQARQALNIAREVLAAAKGLLASGGPVPPD